MNAMFSVVFGLLSVMGLVNGICYPFVLWRAWMRRVSVQDGRKMHEKDWMGVQGALVSTTDCT